MTIESAGTTEAAETIAESLAALLAPETTITGQVFRAETAAAKLADEMQAAIAADEIVASGVATTKFCSKTGQPLGKISLMEFQKLTAVHDTTTARELLLRQSVEHIAPWWIKTDAKALHKLTVHDPHGYFVFAIAKVLGIYYPFPTVERLHVVRNDKMKAKQYHYEKMLAQELEVKCEWLKIKSTTFDFLRQRNLQEIIRANELMRNFLALTVTENVHKIIRWDITDIAKIAASNSALKQFSTDLIENITRMFRYEHSRNTLKINKATGQIKYAEMIEIKNRLEGYSNFRLQGKPEKVSEIDYLIAELAEFLPSESKLRMRGATELPKGTKSLDIGSPVFTGNPGVKLRFNSAAINAATAAATQTISRKALPATTQAERAGQTSTKVKFGLFAPKFKG